MTLSMPIVVDERCRPHHPAGESGSGSERPEPRFRLASTLGELVREVLLGLEEAPA